MKKNSIEEFAVPTKQSYAAILVLAMKSIRTVVRQFWPILILVFAGRRNLGFYFAIGMVIAALVIFLFFALLSYLNFHFFIKDDELYIEKGIFQKTKVNIPFDRIQTINFEQNILHQAFKVVKLKIDTAGSQGSEFELSALDISEASLIRDYILSKKTSLKQNQEGEIGLMESSLPEQESLVFKLSPKDLLKVGVSQNHINTALVILAFVLSLGEQIEQLIERSLEDYISDQLQVNMDHVGTFLLVFIPLFFLVTFLISLIRTILRYFDLRVWKTGNGFKVKSGLINRVEMSALNEKVQIFKWQSNPIRKLFRMFTVRLFQAASSELSSRRAISIVGCYDDQLTDFRADVIPEFKFESLRLKAVNKKIIFRYTLYRGILIALIGTAVLYFSYGWYSLFALVWIPINYFFNVTYHRKFRYATDEIILYTKRGVITDSFDLMKIYKIQSIKMVQSIYQRRKDLASLVIFTAAGSINIPYLDKDKAFELYNYILYKIEISKENWM